MATQQITLRASTDNELIIQCFADDAGSVPFPLDGYTFVAQAKAKTTDDTPLVTFQSSIAPSADHVENHCLVLFLPEADAEILNGKKVVWWDVLFVPPTGLSYRPYEPSQAIIKDAVSER